MADKAYIDALLHERASYARAGRQGKVAAVDAELKRVGHTPDPTPADDPQVPVEPTEPPKKRAPRARQTAQADTSAKSEDSDSGPAEPE